MFKSMIAAALALALATPAMAQSTPSCKDNRVLITVLEAPTADHKLLETLPLERSGFICETNGDKSKPVRVSNIPGSFPNEERAKEVFDAWRDVIKSGVTREQLDPLLSLDSVTRRALATLLLSDARVGDASNTYHDLGLIGVKMKKVGD